jgi:hypothetical protein
VTKTRQNKKPKRGSDEIRTTRRITPGVIEFYTKRAHELRAEYYRNMWRIIWAWLTGIGRR